MKVRFSDALLILIRSLFEGLTQFSQAALEQTPDGLPGAPGVLADEFHRAAMEVSELDGGPLVFQQRAEGVRELLELLNVPQALTRR